MNKTKKYTCTNCTTIWIWIEELESWYGLDAVGSSNDVQLNYCDYCGSEAELIAQENV